MKLYLMRHGETDYNKARCFYGSLDISINAKGRQQAEMLRHLMAEVELDDIFTSQLRRTQETAQIVFGEVPYLSLAGLNERPFGSWEGLNADQIQEKDPITWAAWLDTPFEVTPEDAEPFQEFKERVEETIKKLMIRAPADRLAIVAHLGVLRLIFQYLIDPSADFWQIDFPQGTVTCLEQEGSNWNVRLLK